MKIKRTTSVILLEDVYKTGVAGEVVSVAPGFARNYLIPKSMALPVTTGTLRQMETLRSRAEERRAERQKEFGHIAEKIEGLTLYYPVRAGETGKLYGSVTPVMIADSINEELGLEIDRRRVGDNALRELGVFNVPVRLDAGLSTTVKVVIYREGDDPRLAEVELLASAEEAALQEEAEIAEILELEVSDDSEEEPDQSLE